MTLAELPFYGTLNDAQCMHILHKLWIQEFYMTPFLETNSAKSAEWGTDVESHQVQMAFDQTEDEYDL